MDFGQGLTDAWRAVATFVPKLAAFLLILLIGWFVAKAVAKLVDKVLERVGFDRLLERGSSGRCSRTASTTLLICSRSSSSTRCC